LIAVSWHTKGALRGVFSVSGAIFGAGRGLSFLCNTPHRRALENLTLSLDLLLPLRQGRAKPVVAVPVVGFGVSKPDQTSLTTCDARHCCLSA